jgi:drug/metabolite transporter (DMT)-like permease
VQVSWKRTQRRAFVQRLSDKVSSSIVGVALVSKADNDLPHPEPPTTPPPPLEQVSGSAFSLYGLAATSIGGSNTPPHPLFGDALALVSAVVYAAYVLLLKFRVRDESRVDIMLFFGFVGVFNTLFLWPFLLLLHFTGVETLELPHDPKLILIILVNSKGVPSVSIFFCSFVILRKCGFYSTVFITFTSDILYVIGMLKTGPVTATLALSLAIPLAVLGDIFKASEFGGLQTFIGAMLVVVSFCVVGWADRLARLREFSESSQAQSSASGGDPVLDDDDRRRQ